MLARLLTETTYTGHTGAFVGKTGQKWFSIPEQWSGGFPFRLNSGGVLTFLPGQFWRKESWEMVRGISIAHLGRIGGICIRGKTGIFHGIRVLEKSDFSGEDALIAFLAWGFVEGESSRSQEVNIGNTHNMENLIKIDQPFKPLAGKQNSP